MLEPEPRGVIEDYLGEVAGSLAWAGRRAVADVIDELRDGLLEATDAHTARGAPPQTAARAAVEQFGPARVVADAHASELAIRRARSAAWVVLGALVLNATLWRLGYQHALGVPASVIPPTGAARAVFLIAASAVQALPPLAAVAATLHLLAARRRRAALPGPLAGAAATLCTLALLGQLVMMAALLLTGEAELWTPARTVLTVLLLTGVGGAFAASVVLLHRSRRPGRARPV